jgi:hypothetical protein
MPIQKFTCDLHPKKSSTHEHLKASPCEGGIIHQAHTTFILLITRNGPFNISRVYSIKQNHIRLLGIPPYRVLMPKSAKITLLL